MACVWMKWGVLERRHPLITMHDEAWGLWGDQKENSAVASNVPVGLLQPRPRLLP